MSWFEAILYGLVQGLTEFLPISSTAHLRLLPAVFGWEDPGASFSAVIQLGTMVAVVVFFWRDIVRILVAWFRSLWIEKALRSHIDAKLGWYIILGTVPIGVAGLLFEDSIGSTARNLWVLSISLIVLGIVLWAADKYVAQKKTIKNLTLRDSMIFGLAQVISLIPGSSRSGTTITAGRLLGYRREDAARFSFLLSIPAVVASGLYEARHIGDGAISWTPTIIATVVSFIVGFAAIAWLLRWLGKHSMAVFAVYRVGLGLIIILLLTTGILSAT